MKFPVIMAALLCAGPALAAPLYGPARVIDGDTLAIAGKRVRLWGIDAPERNQSCADAAGAVYACGYRAAEALFALTYGRRVRCAPRDTDRYGRTVAVCWAGIAELNRAMVRGGFAVDYREYSKGAYDADEAAARAAKRGIWDGTFTAPAQWRRENR